MHDLPLSESPSQELPSRKESGTFMENILDVFLMLKFFKLDQAQVSNRLASDTATGQKGKWH